MSSEQNHPIFKGSVPPSSLDSERHFSNSEDHASLIPQNLFGDLSQSATEQEEAWDALIAHRKARQAKQTQVKKQSEKHPISINEAEDTPDFGATEAEVSGADAPQDKSSSTDAQEASNTTPGATPQHTKTPSSEQSNDAPDHLKHPQVSSKPTRRRRRLSKRFKHLLARTALSLLSILLVAALLYLSAPWLSWQYRLLTHRAYSSEGLGPFEHDFLVTPSTQNQPATTSPKSKPSAQESDPSESSASFTPVSEETHLEDLPNTQNSDPLHAGPLDTQTQTQTSTTQAVDPLFAKDAAPKAYFDANELAPINISVRPEDLPAANIALYDIDREEFIFRKENGEKLVLASTAKVFVAACFRDYLALDQQLSTRNAPDQMKEGSSTANIGYNEMYRVEELLYGMIIPSGNDAAYALAMAVADTQAKKALSESEATREFKRILRNWLIQKGYTRTQITDAAGYADDSWSTLDDLARAASAFYKDPVLHKISGIAKYSFTAENGRSFTWENTNALLFENSSYWNRYADGMKTGSLPPHYNLIASANYLGRHLLVLCFDAESTDARYVASNLLFREARRAIERQQRILPASNSGLNPEGGLNP